MFLPWWWCEQCERDKPQWQNCEIARVCHVLIDTPERATQKCIRMDAPPQQAQHKPCNFRGENKHFSTTFDMHTIEREENLRRDSSAVKQWHVCKNLFPEKFLNCTHTSYPILNENGSIYKNRPLLKKRAWSRMSGANCSNAQTVASHTCKDKT